MDRNSVNDLISHHLDCDGMYAKDFTISAGGFVLEHAHSIDHFGILGHGKVRVSYDGAREIYEGFSIITIKAHKRHLIEALTDCRWVCVWPNPENDTDPNVIDERVSEEIA